MSDIGKSGDVVTLPSTGYFLKLVFMFISCIIMNIFMFNCCLNIKTCTLIVSLTVILKCLLNYGIKIYQNIAYLLTIQKPYHVDRTMFGATSFVNAIKPKPFDGSNFKRWCVLDTLWLTAMNVMYVTTRKAPDDVCDNPPRKIPYYRLNQSTLAIKRK
jgi:hypothetical protein